jgi:hypothetical protein
MVRKLKFMAYGAVKSWASERRVAKLVRAWTPDDDKLVCLPPASASAVRA